MVAGGEGGIFPSDLHKFAEEVGHTYSAGTYDSTWLFLTAGRFFLKTNTHYVYVCVTPTVGVRRATRKPWYVQVNLCALAERRKRTLWAKTRTRQLTTSAQLSAQVETQFTQVETKQQFTQAENTTSIYPTNRHW